MTGTLECYARAGSTQDFPDVCGNSPVAVCLQRRVGGELEARELLSIPIGWAGMSEWEACSDEVASAIRASSPCE